MNGEKIYCCFQYFISFMTLLCMLIFATNILFAANYELKSIAAIVDFLVSLIIVKKWVRPNSHLS